MSRAQGVVRTRHWLRLNGSTPGVETSIVIAPRVRAVAIATDHAQAEVFVPSAAGEAVVMEARRKTASGKGLPVAGAARKGQAHRRTISGLRRLAHRRPGITDWWLGFLAHRRIGILIAGRRIV